MSYTQNAPLYEALQWTGGNIDAFNALVDVYGGNPTCALDADGVSLDVADGAWSGIVPAGGWLVSDAYWGTFPGWFLSGAIPMDGPSFTAQYTVTP